MDTQTPVARILAIDDEPFDLMLIDRYLSRAGFQVVRAGGGELAWRTLHEPGCDLRLMTDGIVLTVADEGAGFDWTSFLEIQPERAFDLHGRGIAMSRLMSFDRVDYRGCGNEVELTVLTQAEMEEDGAPPLATLIRDAA